VALPFGVCERVLDDPGNRAVTEEYRSLMASLGHTGARPCRRCWRDCRDAIRAPAFSVRCRAGLRAAMAAGRAARCRALVRSLALACAGLGVKWNDRALWSRRANGHFRRGTADGGAHSGGDCGDYAFVIHTANPMTGDRRRALCRAGARPGEILVGNHPGRALGFCLRRGEAVPRLVSSEQEPRAQNGLPDRAKLAQLRAARGATRENTRRI